MCCFCPTFDRIFADNQFFSSTFLNPTKKSGSTNTSPSIRPINKPGAFLPFNFYSNLILLRLVNGIGNRDSSSAQNRTTTVVSKIRHSLLIEFDSLVVGRLISLGLVFGFHCFFLFGVNMFCDAMAST